MSEDREAYKTKKPMSQSAVEGLVIALEATNNAMVGLMTSIAQQGTLLPGRWIEEDLANMADAREKLA